MGHGCGGNGGGVCSGDGVDGGSVVVQVVVLVKY